MCVWLSYRMEKRLALCMCLGEYVWLQHMLQHLNSTVSQTDRCKDCWSCTIPPPPPPKRGGCSPASQQQSLFCFRSDIPYAALWGADPSPDRSHVMVAAGLQPATRFKPFAEQLSKHLVSIVLPLDSDLKIVSHPPTTHQAVLAWTPLFCHPARRAHFLVYDLR